MTNIEKVKRILDAGHWAKVTYPDGVICTVTSYYEWLFSYFRTDIEIMGTIRDGFKDCTIEVIQRIPTPYKAWDKVLVLSNPYPNDTSTEHIVWKICSISKSSWLCINVWDGEKYSSWSVPNHCLAPAFDEEPTLSGKEAKIVIDGKEYSATLKLI